MRLGLQLANPLLGLLARVEAPADIIRGCGEQDVAHANAIGRTKMLRILLEVTPAVLLGRPAVLHLALQQHANPRLLDRLVVHRLHFDIQPQPLHFALQQFTHHQRTRCVGARLLRSHRTVELHLARDVGLADGGVTDKQHAGRCLTE